MDTLIGQVVTGVRDNPLTNYGVDDGRRRQEVDEAYGYTLTTSKGYCDIIFRNPSNGYYGGGIDKGEVMITLPPHMMRITDDYKA